MKIVGETFVDFTITVDIPGNIMATGSYFGQTCLLHENTYTCEIRIVGVADAEHEIIKLSYKKQKTQILDVYRNANFRI